MSFSYEFKTLRSGNSYDSRTQPETSTHGGENTGEAETGIIEGNEENSMRFSPELIDERTKASLEPLHAQITALTEMMDRLIQSNSAKETTTASSRGVPHQYESPYSEVPGSFRFATVAPLTTAGYSPDFNSDKFLACGFNYFQRAAWGFHCERSKPFNASIYSAIINLKLSGGQMLIHL